MNIRFVLLAVLSAFAPCLAGAGDLLWERVGQPDGLGTAHAGDVRDGVVVASGQSATGSSTAKENWFVRGMDEATGNVLWEDRRDVGTDDRSQGVVIDEGAAFVSGWYLTGSRGVDFVVRAYDLHTGAFRWERRLNRNGADIAETVIASAGRLFVVGSLGGGADFSDFAVLALDEATGRTRWESLTNPTGVFSDDRANAAVADADTVFVSGPTEDGVIVRAYDAATGEIRWEDLVDGGAQIPGRTLALDSGTLYSVGAFFDPVTGVADAVLRAYDARTGTPLWSDRHDHGGNDAGFAVAAGGGRVVLVGGDGCDATFFDCSFFARTYDTSTGALLWENRFQAAPGGDAVGQDVVMHDDEISVGGEAMDRTGTYQWALRTYRIADGSLVWNDVSGAGNILWLRADGDRLLAGGYRNKRYQFATRAYAE